MISTTVGRYRVIRQIGCGGMGEIYLAEDPTLHRNVALKILSDVDPYAKRRFVREAIMASKLSHPKVAAIYEAGEGGLAEETSRHPHILSSSGRSGSFSHANFPTRQVVGASGFVFLRRSAAQ